MARDRDERILEPGQISPDAGWRACDGLPTVAALLTRQGGFDAAEPTKLDRQDYWFRTRLEVARRASSAAKCSRATPSSGGKGCWPAGIIRCSCRLSCRSGAGDGWLYLCLRGTAERPRSPCARRWRTRMIEPKEMRGRRQTLLGHMPGWCPASPSSSGHPDPFRRRDRRALADHATERRLPARHRAAAAEIGAPSRTPRPGSMCRHDPGLHRRCRGRCHRRGRNSGGGGWMPHTHGAPRLYPLVLHGEGRESTIGPIGFRRVTADLGADGAGFGIVINGERCSPAGSAGRRSISPRCPAPLPITTTRSRASVMPA